jgi:hypothetical protein
MLRALKQFPALLSALQIDFVEISPVLEATQFSALQCTKDGALRGGRCVCARGAGSGVTYLCGGSLAGFHSWAQKLVP